MEKKGLLHLDPNSLKEYQVSFLIGDTSVGFKDFDPSKMTFGPIQYDAKNKCHRLEIMYNITLKDKKILEVPTYPKLSYDAVVSLYDKGKVENDVCGICLDKLLNNDNCMYSLLYCGHICHFDCLEEYQKENNEDNGDVICPRCQLNIKI
jgi:hypothetical protein